LRLADAAIIDPPLAPEVNAFRAELGLPPVRHFFDRWMHSPELVIGLFPEWYAPAPPDWPPNVRLTSFPLYDESDTRAIPPELKTFLAEGEPPIIFTAGSAMTQAERFFRTSVDACKARGWRGILLTQFPEQLPSNLPKSIRHFDYVPFSTVLPRARAFVHHGGIGTTAQALAAGVPQLVVPFAHDQPDNAVRVKRLRAGDFLLPARYRVRAAIRKLEALVSSSEVGKQCHRRSADLADSNGLASACDLIETLQRTP
jgi:UDP:flavonoid glycosyltransferase YjiC (YdhE family)